MILRLFKPENLFRIMDKLKPNFLFWRIWLCSTFQNQVLGLIKFMILSDRPLNLRRKERPLAAT
jgi:hypothetical protein